MVAFRGKKNTKGCLACQEDFVEVWFMKNDMRGLDATFWSMVFGLE
jgi:hypothetical protein